MTKAESAASRTPRVDALCRSLCDANDPNGYEKVGRLARALELEAADLRERLAKARTEAIEECARVCDAKIERDSLGTANSAWSCAVSIRALAQPKGEDHGGENAKQHQWSEDGERCIKCGDKDWMGGPCNG